MPSIVAYRKTTGEYSTFEARLPYGATELATLDGVTYVSLPDGVAMPADQPPEIEITTHTITARLRRSLEASSPHSRAARQVADADVAAGRKTRAQADAAVLQRLSDLGLVLTALADIKEARIEADREECRRRLVEHYGDALEQASRFAGGYGETGTANILAGTVAARAASNVARDAINAATTAAQVEAVTVAWPVLP